MRDGVVTTTPPFNPRYPGIAHRGAPGGQARYDPIGTLSLISDLICCLLPILLQHRTTQR
ncbi:hypothetical protein EYY83_00360 [Hafnia alvei]|nr:hypothetical protein EYZ02_18045 [Hafnia alvei]TBM20488.1 hypothetical protein EYY83_00360 [Hafnia alvei]